MAGILYEHECPSGHRQTEMRRLKDRDLTVYCDKCIELRIVPWVTMKRKISPVRTNFKFHDRTAYKWSRK